MFISSVALELLEKRRVGFHILTVREIRSIALGQPWRAIALLLDAVHAKILVIERVSLVATREIGVVHETNYD